MESEKNRKNVDVEVIEEMHTPSYVAQALHIKPTTLRKYSLLVEQLTEDLNRYKRYNNEGQTRQYSDSDINDLKRVIKLKGITGITLRDAVNTVFVDDGASIKDNDIALQDTDNEHDHSAIYNATLNRLMAQNRGMLSKLKTQDELIENKDQQIENLSRLLEESTDALNKNSALLEQVNTTKKGFWSSFFGK